MHVWLLLLSLVMGCGHEAQSSFLAQGSDDSLREKLQNNVTKILQLNTAKKFFTTKDGQQLRYAHYQSELNEQTILILPGYTEFLEKYAEITYDLIQEGFNVVILDHRGMGMSGRGIQEQSKIVHIDHFNTYVADVIALLDYLAIKQPLHLFGHSTGALIGANVVAQRAELFTKVIYNSPLFGLNFGDRNPFIAKSYIAFLNLFKSKSYAPGYQDCGYDDYSFAENNVTHSEIRWDYTRTYEEENPGVWMCGPSVGWVYQVIQATKSHKIKALAEQHSKSVMIFLSQEDRFVDLDIVHKFAELAPAATLRIFDNAKHEIYREKEAYRSIMMNDMLKFLRGEN